MLAIYMLTAVWLGTTLPPPNQPEDPLRIDLAPKPPDCKKCGFAGKVIRITPTQLTIDGEGDLPGNTRFLGQRTFAPSAILQTGGFDPLAAPVFAAMTYRWTDVKVGDRVFLEFSRTNGRYICDRISIMRRPGGRVPPAPGEDPRYVRGHTYHERMNAEQDWEEKGIPIPDRLCTSFELEKRAAAAKIAPPPREVKPKSPPAKE